MEKRLYCWLLCATLPFDRKWFLVAKESCQISTGLREKNGSYMPKGVEYYGIVCLQQKLFAWLLSLGELGEEDELTVSLSM